MKIFDTLEIKLIGIDKPMTVKEFINKSKEDSEFLESNKPNISLIDIVDKRFTKFALDCRSKMFKEFLHKSEENIRNIIKENSKVLSQNEVAKFKIADIQQMIYDDEREVIRQRLENLKLSWSDWRIAENLLFRANSLLISLNLIDSAGNAFKEGKFGIFDSLNNINKTDVRYAPAISYSLAKPSPHLIYLADGRGEPDVVGMEPLNVEDLKYVKASFVDIVDGIEGSSDGGAFSVNVYDDDYAHMFFNSLVARKVTRKCPEELKEDYLEVLDRIERTFDYLLNNCDKAAKVINSISVFQAINQNRFHGNSTKDIKYFQTSREYAEKGLYGADLSDLIYNRVYTYLPITEAVSMYITLELSNLHE